MTPTGLEIDERRLQTFVDSIPSLAWMADGEGWIVWYNRRWYEYTGTTPSQMEGWGWQSVHDPAVLPSVMERWTASIRTGSPFEMVFPLRGGDGILRSFLTRVVPVRDDHGNITQWFGTNVEIDELQRTREALQTGEAKYRKIAEDLRDANRVMELTEAETRSGFWQYWPRQQRLLMSAGTLQLFGLAQVAAATLQDAFLRIHADDRAMVSAALLEAETTGQYSISYRIVHPDGAVRWIASRASVLFDGPDGPHLVGVNVDITSQKRMEEKLLKSEKLAVVGRLAATISHELNNPLESVTNLLFLMQQSVSTEEEIREYARMAQDELARVSHIVTHTLRFHRHSTHSTDEMLEPLLESALALHGGKMKSAGVRVMRSYAQTRPLECFSGELRQVFANLIGNAIDAMREGGTIRVGVRQHGDSAKERGGVRVSISDTGHGMDAATELKLFEPFFSTKGENGTGLGLWVSRQIVSKHGGAMRVRSRRAGSHRGTLFVIDLPYDSLSSDFSPPMLEA